MDTSLSALAVIALAFLLAGFVKGGIGMGLPTVSVGLLALVMAPAQAAALLVVPSLVTNIWQMLLGPDIRALLRRLWPVLLGICLGTLAGGGLLVMDASGGATAAIGMVLMLYAVFGLTGTRFALSRSSEAWAGPLAGFTTGVISAPTSIFVLPVLPYYQAIGLEKDDLVQTLGLSFTVSTLAITIVLAKNGVFSTTMVGPSALAMAAAAVGMVLGQAARARVSAETFRRWFFLGMLVLGAHLASRAVW
jgi:uncharacterized membrane protein YfcA